MQRERDAEAERRQSLGAQERSRDQERGKEKGQRRVGEKYRGRERYRRVVSRGTQRRLRQ